MGKVYSIVNIIKIHDQKKFNNYVAGHLDSIERYDGKFLVKGDRGIVLEGSWDSNLMVVHEFPSLEQFNAWYLSEEYRPWKVLRQSCADVNVILVHGN